MFNPTEASLTLQNIDQMLTKVLDWHNLGVKLGLPHHILENIRIDFSTYGNNRQKQEMIITWLAYDTEASWIKLANALKAMEKHVLAKEIQDRHAPGYRSKFASDISGR